MENKRNTGVDLLKIVSMFMICVLHTLSHGGILGNAKTTINFFGMWSLDLLFNVAVDCYALISGFFAQNKQQNYKRIIRLWFIAFFYSVVIAIIVYIASDLIKGSSLISIEELLQAFLPANFGNWYFKAYFSLFFLMPFVNKALNNIYEEECKKFLVLLIIVFSLFSLINDSWFNSGLHSMWLLVLYIVGALIRKGDVFKNYKNSFLIVTYLISSFLSWLFGIYFDLKPFRVNTSPTIVIAAICLLVLFSRINIKNKIITYVSPLTFGIYLFHDNPYIRNLFIEDKFVFVTNYNLVVGGLMVLVIAACIFVVSAIA